MMGATTASRCPWKADLKPGRNFSYKLVFLNKARQTLLDGEDFLAGGAAQAASFDQAVARSCLEG